jgi:hypothetical protein
VRSFGLGIVLISLGPVSTDVRADDGIEPVRVQFEGTVECSDAARFFAEVRARTPRVRLAAADEPARLFRVHMVNRSGGVEGSVSTVDRAEVSTPRAIDATTCEEAIAALAFIAALSVDPTAALHAGRVPPQPSAPPPPSPSAAPPQIATSSPTPPPTPEIPPAPSLAPLEPGGAPADTRPLPSTRHHAAYFVAIGAGPTASGPDAPSTGIGGRAFIEAGRTAGLAPSVRLSFDLPSERRLPIGAGVATFTWIRGGADVCPIRLKLIQNLSTEPCGGVEVGILEGAGSSIVDARTLREAWVAGVIEGRLRYDFLWLFFADLDLGVTIPFTREQFVFLPAPTVYQAPPAFLRALVAVGARFP